MQIYKTQQKNSPNFSQKLKFNLSKETIKLAEETTKLSYKELCSLSFDETTKLMQERGSLKKTNKIKEFCTRIYKNIGEKLGLLERQHNIYTDIH